jgi:hypothetical protein
MKQNDENFNCGLFRYRKPEIYIYCVVKFTWCIEPGICFKYQPGIFMLRVMKFYLKKVIVNTFWNSLKKYVAFLTENCVLHSQVTFFSPIHVNKPIKKSPPSNFHETSVFFNLNKP